MTEEDLIENAQKVVNETIPKKLAAQELYKTLKVNFNTNIVLICAVFVVAITANFSDKGGAISAGIIAAGAGWVLYTTKRKLEYYKSKYEL